MTPINLSDYEKLAEERIEPGAWGYFQGGSDDEVTLRECRAAFQRIKLRPRMLVDVSTIDMHTTVLGTPHQSTRSRRAYRLSQPGASRRRMRDRARNGPGRYHHDCQFIFQSLVGRNRGCRDKAALVPTLQLPRPAIYRKSGSTCRSSGL